MALLRVHVPWFQGDDTSQSVEYTVVSQEDEPVAPRAVWQLVVGDPVEGRRELRGVAAVDVLHERHPRCVIGRDADLTVVHRS